MKKVLFPILAIGLLMASCLKDEGNHLTQVVKPNGSSFVFADQVTDTLWYRTTERHTLTSSVSWLKPLDDVISTINFKDETLYDIRVPVHFEANTTGRLRGGTVTINAGNYSAGAFFAQVPFLQVTRPQRIIDGNSLEVIRFGPLTDSASVTVDSISFTTYDTWSLSTGTWAKPEQTTGAPGSHTVRLTLQPNVSTVADRRDTLFLTSRGVRDTIPLLQYKRIVSVE